MRRIPAALVATTTALALLSGCSADRQYCRTVDDHKSELADFGKKSSKRFKAHAAAIDEIVAVAPAGVVDDWKAIGKATKAVLKAQKDVGIDLSDMRKADKIAGLTSAQVEELNVVYEKFNATRPQRESVVKDVRTRCKIDLADVKGK